MTTYGFQRQTLESSHKGELRFAGSFRPNGSSTPTIWYGNWISSIAHTATGVWTITMKEKYRGLQGILAAIVSARFNALSLTVIQLGAIDLDAGTIIIRAATESGGTLAAADIASNANNWIDLDISLQYTKTPDGSGITT